MRTIVGKDFENLGKNFQNLCEEIFRANIYPCLIKVNIVIIMKTHVLSTLTTVFIGYYISFTSAGPEVDRIFKGWFLSPHEFPWMVKLKVR